jgi:DNA-binding NarL/FixJ family response regulator
VGNCGPVLIVDDDASIRELIGSLLARVGFASRHAASAEQALELAERETPSVAIVDVHLGGGKSGYEVCHELRERLPDLAIVFVSGERTESFDRVAGFLLGADDYIVKPFDPDELIARVRRLAERGEKRPASQRPSTNGHSTGLTSRELQVLRLLAGGLGQTEIARELSLSPKTVATHIQNILAKLGVHSRAQAVAMAHRLGLMDESVQAHLLALSS